MGENIRHQLTVAQVVRRQPCLVLLEQAADFFAAPGTLKQLAGTEQLVRHGIQSEAFEAVEGSAQQFNAINQQAPRQSRGAPLSVLIQCAPVYCGAGATQTQWYTQGIRQSLQVPGIKIHYIPANQHIRIDLGNEVKETFQHRALRGQRFNLLPGVAGAQHENASQLLAGGVPCCRCHVHGNRIQLQAFHGRFNVERGHGQLRTQCCGTQLWVAHVAVTRSLLQLTRQLGAPGDEPLHQVTIGRIDVRLQRVRAALQQAVGERSGLPVAGTVDTHHGLHGEIAQTQWLELHAGLQRQ